MEAKENLKERHTKALVRLQKVANPKVYKWGLMKCAEAIAPNIGVSKQTVINYLAGRTKDGYLTESIISEFKKLHIHTN